MEDISWEHIGPQINVDFYSEWDENPSKLSEHRKIWFLGLMWLFFSEQTEEQGWKQGGCRGYPGEKW